MIRNVLIVGSGVAAAMAALAVKRRIPGLTVTRLDNDRSDPIEDMFGAARPSIRTFQERLEIDEVEIVSRTKSGFRLGTLMQGWTANPYFRGHAEHGNNAAGIPFHQLWLKAGRAGAFDLFSPASRLAAAQRFAFPSDERDSPLAALDYGLHLDVPAYTAALRALGQAAGVQASAGRIAGAELRADGRSIAAIGLDDGRHLSADLYIDAAGSEARIRRSLPVDPISWSNQLPIDRLLLTVAGGTLSPPPFDRLTALPDGWIYELTTPASTMGAFAYNSALLPDARAIGMLRDITGREPAGPAIPLSQGRLEDPWRSNCVAIGAAAVTLEPLAQSGLHLICRHIERLIACWPGADMNPAELAFYNRRTGLEADRVRDFVQAHYALSTRRERFWTDARSHAPSPELARDLALFAERGRLTLHDEDSIARDEWLALLLSQGVIPRRLDAATDMLAPEAAGQMLIELHGRLERMAESAPAHRDWLGPAQSVPARNEDWDDIRSRSLFRT